MKDLEAESQKIAAKIQDTQNKMQSEAKQKAMEAAREAQGGGAVEAGV